MQFRRLAGAVLLVRLATVSAHMAPPANKSGPTFAVKDSEIHLPLTFILYGDQRFMDPKNTSQASPTMRQLLVKQIALEKPAAIVLNGDVPNDGRLKEDYAVYQSETQIWRDENLLVIPTLGNHEVIGDEKPCLENWWNAFPQLRNRRWYSTQLGSRVYIVALDSTSALTPGSDQAKWLAQTIDGMSSTIDFLVITLHHPPVADVQTHIMINHNPRPNEVALRDYLSQKAKTIRARILVSAGHIHNYERHEQAGITYLVAGGGGAFPYIVERTPDDLYQDTAFPNYHYVKCVLEGATLKSVMYRAAEPENPDSKFEQKDSFTIVAKPRKAAAAVAVGTGKASVNPPKP
jgi:hypothetical protein